MQQYNEEEPISLLEYRDILKRRRFLFWLPVAALALVTAILAFTPPSTYRSEATILIEDQEIPADIVGATITNYVSQQIQLISQRLLTVKNIQSVVEKFDVYHREGQTKQVPAAVLANRFRQDMELDLVSTDVNDPRGRSDSAAIAFTLAFNSTDPRVSQMVTEELVLLFLNENQRSSVSRSSGVSEFLRAAVDEANEELLLAEADLADFKESHEGALPELHELNLNVINRTTEQLSDVNLRIQQLEQRKLQLTAQLTSISPSAPVTLPSGETVLGDRERLRAALIDFRRKSAIYQPGHPDLISLEREIELLQKTVGDMGSRDLLEEQLRQERERLEFLRDRYSEDYPDIKNSEAAIAAIESQLANTDSQIEVQVEGANNPAYVLIDTQLQSANLEIQGLLQKRTELQAKVAEHEELIKQAPRVEMQYEGLLRTYENARTNYRDLQAKLRAADVAANVDQEITGRRFTLLEPPLLPLNPDGPNRSVIVLLGLILSIGVGVACVVIAELIDDSIRGAKKLATIAGAPPLAVIPYLDNSVDIAHARTQRNYLISALFSILLLSIVFVHFFIRPLSAFL